jgi:hypothetical protein
MTLATIETYITACIAAIASGDYATAYDQAMAAQAAFLLLPDASGADKTVRFRQEQVQQLIQNILRKQGAAAGIQVSNIEYAAVDGTGSSNTVGDLD